MDFETNLARGLMGTGVVGDMIGRHSIDGHEAAALFVAARHALIGICEARLWSQWNQVAAVFHESWNCRERLDVVREALMQLLQDLKASPAPFGNEGVFRTAIGTAWLGSILRAVIVRQRALIGQGGAESRQPADAAA